MFGIFYNGQFVDFWHNRPGDQGWINRTILAMGWNRAQVDVLFYGWTFDPTKRLAFDSEKNLSILEAKDVDVLLPKENEEDPDAFETKTVFEATQSISGEFYLKAGKVVRQEGNE